MYSLSIYEHVIDDGAKRSKFQLSDLFAVAKLPHQLSAPIFISTPTPSSPPNYQITSPAQCTNIHFHSHPLLPPNYQITSSAQCTNIHFHSHPFLPSQITKLHVRHQLSAPIFISTPPFPPKWTTAVSLETNLVTRLWKGLPKCFLTQLHFF